MEASALSESRELLMCALHESPRRSESSKGLDENQTVPTSDWKLQSLATVLMLMRMAQGVFIAFLLLSINNTILI